MSRTGLIRPNGAVCFRQRLAAHSRHLLEIGAVAPKTLQIGESMNNVNLSNLSRRRFMAAAGLGAATAVFPPRLLFAQETGIVPTMINEAARAKIEVQALPRNISVLDASGRNIAVLP